VHGRDLAATLRGHGEGDLRDAAAGRAGDLAHRQGDIRRRHELAGAGDHVAVRVETLRRLAHDDQVHVRAAMRHAGPGPRRSDVGEQVQFHTEGGRDVDPAPVAGRVVEMRDRSEQDAVGGAGAFENGPGAGRAGAFERLEPDRHALETQTEGEPAVDHFEQALRRVGDLGADAVAGQDQDIHQPTPAKPSARGTIRTRSGARMSRTVTATVRRT
jgi:hypothetical protein